MFIRGLPDKCVTVGKAYSYAYVTETCELCQNFEVMQRNYINMKST